MAAQAVVMDRAVLEALSRVEQVEGLSDRELCENFTVMYNILEHCDPQVVAKYILEDRPLLFDVILDMCRMDIVPLDVPAKSVFELLHEYSFFRIELNPSDKIVVQDHRLTISSLSTSMLTIPELRFGSNREVTIAFYFTVDDFGSKNCEKEFGFSFGNCKV
eukprot:TRINITY_DN70255_c0_g1_i1.p3 TRINITY_DN70255_c0_g1~~TRINITY_DN70255_c0_g1_i1.p3  ORF type:complete len:162 (+),score=33.63 TRINITY_DN70255_c0_g1_i1:301-786(+)